MRYEFSNHIISSALNVVSKLQQVVEDPALRQAQKTHAAAVAHPNLSGCVDSPEASTIILMLVGTIGIYYGSKLFLKLGRKNTVAAL